MIILSFFPAMTLAGKLYFDAVSKIGESAAVSPVSRELGKFPCCPFFWLSSGIFWGTAEIGSEIVVYLAWISEALLVSMS